MKWLTNAKQNPWLQKRESQHGWAECSHSVRQAIGTCALPALQLRPIPVPVLGPMRRSEICVFFLLIYCISQHHLPQTTVQTENAEYACTLCQLEHGYRGELLDGMLLRFKILEEARSRWPAGTGTSQDYAKWETREEL